LDGVGISGIGRDQMGYRGGRFDEGSRHRHERLRHWKKHPFKDELVAFKDECRPFKDECRPFKDELVAFKDECRPFKDECRPFKDECWRFKDEYFALKDECLTFKDESAGRLEMRNAARGWGGVF
jgi:hypothetical protein